MIFYTYDEKTKEYTGAQNAFIDPLETKKQCKEVYLVPPNVTDKKPLEAKENQAVIFNGSEWEIIADYRNKTYYIGTEQHEMKELGDLPNGATFEPVEPKKSLSELKSDKLSKLHSKSSKFQSWNCSDMYIKSSLGITVNADQCSQNNIAVLIEMLPDNEKTTSFKLFDNSFKDLNRVELQTLLSECHKNGLALYQQKFAIQAEIVKATTKEELDAIVIDFVNADYSL